MALREEEAGGALAAGDRVRIKGLRARPDLNGKEGQVRRPPFNEQAPWSCARTAAREASSSLSRYNVSAPRTRLVRPFSCVPAPGESDGRRTGPEP